MEMILDAIVFIQKCGISLIMVGCVSRMMHVRLFRFETGFLFSSTTTEELFSLLPQLQEDSIEHDG